MSSGRVVQKRVNSKNFDIATHEIGNFIIKSIFGGGSLYDNDSHAEEYIEPSTKIDNYVSKCTREAIENKDWTALKDVASRYTCHALEGLLEGVIDTKPPKGNTGHYIEGLIFGGHYKKAIEQYLDLLRGSPEVASSYFSVVLETSYQRGCYSDICCLLKPVYDLAKEKGKYDALLRELVDSACFEGDIDTIMDNLEFLTSESVDTLIKESPKKAGLLIMKMKKKMGM